jgi:hypothetical protein
MEVPVLFRVGCCREDEVWDEKLRKSSVERSMPKFTAVLRAIIVLVILRSASNAALVTIDFDGMSDGLSASGLYTSNGVTISSGSIAVSGLFGGSLNEMEFPPRSGEGVFLNDSDTTIFTFSTPIQLFDAYLTYNSAVAIHFYESSNNLLTSIFSGFQTNTGLSGEVGSAPNERFFTAGLANASRLEIVVSGADFTLDDLSFEFVANHGGMEVPEPGSQTLAWAALALMLYNSRK